MTSVIETHEEPLARTESAAPPPPSAPQTPPAPPGSRLTLVLALLAIYIIWGTTYLAIRIAVETMPPFFMAAVRFLAAGALLFAFLRLRGAPLPTRGQWLGASAVGALLLVGGNGAVSFAEKWISSGLAALVVGTIPLWAALFAGLWGRWPSRLEWVGLALGFVGIVLLNLESNIQANPLAAVVLFLAPIFWAFGSVLSRHVSLPKGLMSSAAEMLVGGVGCLLLSLVLGERVTVPVSMGSLLAVVYLVVFGSIIAYSAYTYLLARVRPALATSYAYVNPAVAVALGVGLAGEQLTLAGFLAMLAILSAVVMITLGVRTSKP
ncbi:MAG: drug/metabolite exporter YedA [Chloroflexia bacterium]